MDILIECQTGGEQAETGGGLTTTGASQTDGYEFGLGANGADGNSQAAHGEGNGGSGGGYYGGTASTDAFNVGGRGGSGYVSGLILGNSISGINDGNGHAKITFVNIK